MSGPWSRWRVEIDGQNRISEMGRYLLQIEYVDQPGVESDTCRLTFDDSLGQQQLPPPRTPVRAFCDGYEVYSGVVDSTPWRFARGEGRVLDVNLKAFDTRSKAVEPQDWHLDDVSLEDFLAKAAKRAGIAITVDPAFAKVTRDYWSPQGQSFVELGEKLRQEFGATFKMRGGTEAVFAARGTGLSPFGDALPTVAGIVPAPGSPGPGNVINANIDPTRGRPRAKEKRVTWFDPKTAKFVEKRVSVALEDVGEAIETQRWPAAEEGQGETMAQSQKTDAEQDAGVGSVILEFTPLAFVEGMFRLSGARPGIDGDYRIAGVTGRATRGEGSVTQLQLAQPQGGAGKDTRKAS